MGRRFGKTLLASNEIIKEAASRPGTTNWWVAPVYKQTLIGYGMVENALASANMIKRHRRTLNQITILNNSVIEFLTASNPDNLRGPGVNFLVMDECAMIAKAAWEEVLRPTLADSQGRGLFIGTPKARNWFWEMWQRGKDPSQTDYESFQLPTSANPFIAREEIEEARQKLPQDVFKQEWLAQFLEESAGVFRNIKGCIRGEWSGIQDNRPVVPGHTYVIGWDVAKYTNFSVLTCMDRSIRQQVAFDRFNQIDWSFQLAKAKAMSDKYNRAPVIMDATGAGDPLVEQARGRGIPVQPFMISNQSKQQLIENLAINIEQEKVHYFNIPQLILELEMFQYEMSKSRNIIYQAPEGYDDDTVLSLALAVWSLKASRFFEQAVAPGQIIVPPEPEIVQATAQSIQEGWTFDPTTGTVSYPDGRDRGGWLF